MVKITGTALAVFAVIMFAAMPAHSASKRENFELYMEKGMMKYQQQDMDGAIDLLEQAERIRPNDVELLFYLGQAYEKSGDVNQGRAYFERVYELEPDSDYGKISREYLDAFEGGDSKRYFLNIRTGAQYDSNVILKPDTPLVFSSNDRVDWKWLFDVKGGYALPFFKVMDLNVTYQFYQSLHFDLDDYDVQAHTFEVYPSYKTGPFTVMGGYKHRYSYFGGNSYSANNGLFVRVSSKFADRFKAQVGYELTEKNSHTSEDRDASNRKYSGDLYYYFFDGDGQVRLGVFYAEENANASKYNYDGYGVRGAIGVPLPLDVDLLLDGSYENRRYGKRLSLRHFEFRNRKNYKYIWTAALEREIYRGLGVMVAYTMEQNDSTFEEYDYDRNLVTIYLTGKF